MSGRKKEAIVLFKIKDAFLKRETKRRRSTTPPGVGGERKGRRFPPRAPVRRGLIPREEGTLESKEG